MGCGAVGSLFAANLSLWDDVEVWAFDLNELHVAAMNRDGLRLTGAGDVVGRPRGTSDAAGIPDGVGKSREFGTTAFGVEALLHSSRAVALPAFS